MYRYTVTKRIVMIALISVLGLFMHLFGFFESVSAAEKHNRPKNIRTYITYNKLYVGEIRSLKVAPRKASIKVRFLPDNPANKNKGVSVASSNSRVIKVIRENKFHFKLKAVKAGNATITIKSLGKGYYGKKLTSKIRLRVEDNKPLESITASRNEARQIKLTFDSIIRDKFDKNQLKVKLYDKDNEKFIKDVYITNFEYLKDSNYDVLLNLNSEIESNSTYRIEYKNMYTDFTTENIGVAKIELVNKKIPRNRSSLLIFKALDDDGNDITNTGYFKSSSLTVKLSDNTSSKVNLTGDSTNAKLLMLETGSKAVLEVSYNNIKQNFEVVCDDNIDTALYNLYKSTVVYKGYGINWNEVRENETAILDQDLSDGFVAILLKTGDGKLISNRSNDKYYEPTASFEYSVNKGSKLKVDSKTGALGKAKDGRYSVRIKMTYQENTYQYSVPIKIEKTKAGLLSLNPSELTISNQNGKAEVSLTYRNSYGKIVEERNIKSNPVITYTNADADSSKTNSEPAKLAGLVKVSASSKLKLDIDAVGKPAGTYHYEILMGDPKKNFAKTYLKVFVQDSTTDSMAWDYKFKDILENPNIDLNVTAQNYSLSDIKDKAKGVSLELFSYNQFGTAIGPAPVLSYKVNGNVIDLSKMPYLKYNGGSLYFTPYEVDTVTVDGKNMETLTKLAKPGVYNITAEIYHPKFNRKHTYSASLTVTDNSPSLQENIDFKVKRTGVNGATTILQPGMSSSTSDLAAQLVTKTDGSRFIPQVTATGFDVRYPKVPVYYMSYGNNYIIDKVSIPVPFITRDGSELYIYMEQNLYIHLTK